ncbi:MAG TPA: hypothetical protein DCY13_21665 [Verrucomicrobiales bacterium]|nr:hypothetical protein [Verrucomicrobiales bacterium]
MPVIEVLETRPAGWSEPRSAVSGGSHGNWNGLGGSLHPSIHPEPLPCPVNVGPDRDGDGVPDAQDKFPDDPTETSDTDGDGIGNNADLDDDNDGIPDDYEFLHGLNPDLVDALGDLDLDGLNNIGEWVAGTAANDSRSVLAFDRIDFDAGGSAVLAWPSVTNRIYEVLFATDPARSFVPYAPRITASNNWITVELALPRGQPEGYFRLQVRPPSTSPP